MNTGLQNKAWHILPKEFKEEVKRKFQLTDADCIAYEILIDLFGLHNLTSDAEGEEVLTVSANTVRAYKENIDKYLPSAYSAYDKGFWTGQKAVFEDLFGSKCLLDEGTDCTPVEVGVAENATTNNVDSLDSNVESLEPKSAKPKFKEGDIVRYRYDGKLYTVVCKTGKYYYALRQPDGDVMIHDVLESDLEPYTEPKKKRHVSVKEACEILGVDESEATTLVKSKPIETCTDDCSSPDHFVVKDEMVDNIIKDGFAKERRLNIAAQMAQSILRNNDEIYRASVESKAKTTPAAIAEYAFALADALLAECEKKGGQDA